jgi:hypothetical protein
MDLVRIIKLGVPILNVILVCVNFYFIATNQSTITKLQQSLKDNKDLESAYKRVLCELSHHMTGEDNGHILTTTLEGKMIQFDCPRKV